jgi:hypothetical protein
MSYVICNHRHPVVCSLFQCCSCAHSSLLALLALLSLLLIVHYSLLLTPTTAHYCSLLSSSHQILAEYEMIQQGLNMADIVKKFQTVKMVFNQSKYFTRDSMFFVSYSLYVICYMLYVICYMLYVIVSVNLLYHILHLFIHVSCVMCHLFPLLCNLLYHMLLRLLYVIVIHVSSAIAFEYLSSVITYISI